MYAYSVYGLSLHSDFPIPEMLAAASILPAMTAAGLPADLPSPDVLVTIGPMPDRWSEASIAPSPQPGVEPGSAPHDAEPDDVGFMWSERRAASNETLCAFDGVGRYLIEGGRTIVVAPDPGVDFDLVRHLLLGPVLAQLLWQRDVFTLHASVLGFDAASGSDRARKYAAFVGVSGEGKSTTAAALEAAGHPLVCDDVAALVAEADGFRVLPAFPRIRLYADSVSSVGDDPEQYPLVHSMIDKRSKSVVSLVAEPVPLDRLYVLDTGDSFAITPLAPREAVVEVLRHTYYAHQYAPLYGFKKHLEQAARVAERVAAFRLTRPKDLTRLPELVRLLEAHAAS